MDLSLWEPPDAAAAEINYKVGDAVNLDYSPDVIEEAFLNERSCVQVLKIWMKKADAEIIELEDDILMIKCQLAWDDVNWSEPCSAALIEKINHLDILIQSLESEMSEDVQYLAFQILKRPDNLAQRLHELVKPLLENYLSGKSMQAADQYGKVTSKLNEPNEKLVLNPAHVQARKFSSVKTEPPDSTEKASNASIGSSRGRAERETTEEVLKTKAVRPKLEHEKTQETGNAKCTIMKNMKSGNITRLRQRHETLKLNQAQPNSALTMGEKKTNPSRMDFDPLAATVKKKSLGSNVRRFTLLDLKVIAKNRNLKGYSKLKKKELLELLGLEEALLH